MDLGPMVHPRFCSHSMELASGRLILALRCTTQYLNHSCNERRGFAVYARLDAGLR